MSYKCGCYAYLNLYLEKYGYHFRYFNHSQFLQDYQQMLSEKYNNDEINEISQQIKALQDSKKQEDSKAYERLQHIRKLYKPLHKNIYTFDECFLENSFKSLVAACKKGDRDLIDATRYPNEEVKVFTFRVFTKDFIKLFLEEINHISNYDGIVLGRPNSMNHNGVLMKELGMDEMLTVLREEYLQPIVDTVFSDTIGECESHRGFTVKYSFDGAVFDGSGDKQLGKHYDNAEVTLNVCMQADQVQGSNLVFMGMANDEDCDRERIHLEHEVGMGILHLGQLKHYVTPIEQGVRTNLVLWLRSSAVRNKVCPMCWDSPEIVATKCMDDGFRP